MKQAIIVGASSGIGYELAVQLAAKGYQLGLVARRLEKLEQLSSSSCGGALYCAVRRISG